MPGRGKRSVAADPDHDWQALAQAVIDRRVHLGFRSRESFCAEVDFAPRMLGDLERCDRRNFDRVTMSRLEQGLRWPAGTVRAILTGSTAPTIGDAPKVDRPAGAGALNRLAALLDPRGPLSLPARTALEISLSALADFAEATNESEEAA